MVGFPIVTIVTTSKSYQQSTRFEVGCANSSLFFEAYREYSADLLHVLHHIRNPWCTGNELFYSCIDMPLNPGACYSAIQRNILLLRRREHQRRQEQNRVLVDRRKRLGQSKIQLRRSWQGVDVSFRIVLQRWLGEYNVYGA